MRIGFSYWGVWDAFTPGHQLDTPDGHRYGRRIFMQELLDRGHELVVLQERRENEKYPGVSYPLEHHAFQAPIHDVDRGSKFPELDVIFMEWRWSTYKNDKAHPDYDPERYEPDLDRQRELIEYYHGRIPIIVWDTDLKVTVEDEEAYPELILTDPSFETNRLTRDRTSLPFWTDWGELLPCVEPLPIYGYVGNNYERPEEFEKYYFATKQDTRIVGVQTSMYGNWLQKSPERVRPETLISTHREVAFNHRMNFFDSMKMMNKFVCTTHVSKPRYYETGFISPRYLEALAVNCPAIVPSGMAESPALNGKSLLGEKYVATKPADVRDLVGQLKVLSVEQRKQVIESQREALKQCGKFDVKNVVEFIEGVV